MVRLVSKQTNVNGAFDKGCTVRKKHQSAATATICTFHNSVHVWQEEIGSRCGAGADTAIIALLMKAKPWERLFRLTKFMPR